ncbi:hypothetical protein EV126DRAFT_138099 [Verticillium dahliae]|nr:hypothetical protein EV126DRAFT_138099 [Verticillium dahliae]
MTSTTCCGAVGVAATPTPTTTPKSPAPRGQSIRAPDSSRDTNCNSSPHDHEPVSHNANLHHRWAAAKLQRHCQPIPICCLLEVCSLLATISTSSYALFPYIGCFSLSPLPECRCYCSSCSSCCIGFLGHANGCLFSSSGTDTHTTPLSLHWTTLLLHGRSPSPCSFEHHWCLRTLLLHFVAVCGCSKTETDSIVLSCGLCHLCRRGTLSGTAEALFALSQWRGL